MSLCSKCIFYNKDYDERLQEYDDVIKIGDDREKHHCPMYDDNIPPNIFYDDGECEFFTEKEAAN